MKAFPQNIVVKAFLTTQITEGTESVPLTVETTTNIVLLPKVPMTPRFADRRVGFLRLLTFISMTNNRRWKPVILYIAGGWNRNRRI